VKIELAVIKHLRPEAAIDQGADVLDEHPVLIFRDSGTRPSGIDVYLN
jgi:hypothetical protein